MEPSRQTDPHSLSLLIEQHLRETNRSAQAEALERQPLLRVLLDTLIERIRPLATNLAFAQIAGWNRQQPKHPVVEALEQAQSKDSLAFLTSDHEVLVLHFHHVAERAGEIAILFDALDSPHVWKYDNDLARDGAKEVMLTWLKACETVTRKRIPLAGSLEKLEPVGELSPAYRDPDLSDERLRPTDFLLS